MSDKLSTTMAAEALPPEIKALMRHRPLPGTRYRVIVEAVEETDSEKIERLRTHVGEGLAEADRGELLGEDEVFAPLLARYPSDNAS